MAMSRALLAGNALAVVLALAGCASSSAVSGDLPAVEASTLLEVEQQAAQAYSAGDHEQAARLYSQMAKAMPEEPDYWYRLANSLVRTGHYGEAELSYQRMLALRPQHARAWHNLGVVRMRLAQEAFAGAVRHSNPDQLVFKESLELSTSLFTLVGGERREVEPPTAATE